MESNAMQFVDLIFPRISGPYNRAVQILLPAAKNDLRQHGFSDAAAQSRAERHAKSLIHEYARAIAQFNQPANGSRFELSNRIAVMHKAKKQVVETIVNDNGRTAASKLIGDITMEMTFA